MACKIPIGTRASAGCGSVQRYVACAFNGASGLHKPSNRVLCLASVAAPTVQQYIDNVDKQKLDDLMFRFQIADADGNGKIDREELRLLLESMEDGKTYLHLQHWLPEEELDRVMALYDMNGNGTIELEEFEKLVLDGLLLEGKLTEYEEAFKAVDRSGNGTIGANELALLMANLGQPMSLEKVVEVMQQYDKDESGQIEFNEFLMMFRNNLLDLKEVQKYMASMPSRTSQEAPVPPHIMDAMPGDLNLIFSEQEFDEVLQHAGDKLVVVFAGLTWCRPCKAMHRPVQKLAAAYSKHMLVLTVFGNSNGNTKHLFKERLKVRSTPCFIIYKNSEVVYTQTGANKERLEEGLRQALEGKQLPEPLYPKPANA